MLLEILQEERFPTIVNLTVVAPLSSVVVATEAPTLVATSVGTIMTTTTFTGEDALDFTEDDDNLEPPSVSKTEPQTEDGLAVESDKPVNSAAEASFSGLEWSILLIAGSIASMMM